MRVGADLKVGPYIGSDHPPTGAGVCAAFCAWGATAKAMNIASEMVGAAMILIADLVVHVTCCRLPAASADCPLPTIACRQPPS